jgi:uncharacterized protein YneF (UPF0154 family)
MPTPAADTRIEETPGVGTAAKQVAEHASTLARLEFELAGLELKSKVGALGAGAGLGVGAAIVVLYGIGFLFATAAVALALVLDLWLAMLIVTLGLFAIAGLLAFIAVRLIKRGAPPVPEQAIREAKLTQEALRANGNR